MLTEAQKKQRLGKITSSVAAGALGVHPYMTQLDAFMAITGRSQFTGNAATERGDILEQPLLRWCADELGLRFEQPEFRKHPIFNWAGDSVDALYYDGSDMRFVGEAKTASGRAALDWGDDGTDQVPAHIAVQCHWHLLHYPEVNRCMVPMFVGGSVFEARLYHVDRDRVFEEGMLEKLGKWHRDHVQADRPPRPEAGDAGIIASLYPRDDGSRLEDEEEVSRWARVKHEASLRLAEAQAAEEFAKNQLRVLMGKHQICSGRWGHVTYKNNCDSEVVDYKALVKELKPPEELIAKHTKTKAGARVLRVVCKGVANEDQ